MKKIYENPVTTIVNVELQKIMQTSTNVNLGGSYNGGFIESRSSRNDWDDEDYE